MDWDELRVVLAVAETGSLAGAARILRINHTTAMRRLDALEEHLKVRLFDRHRDGYLPTEEGALIAEEARHISPRVDELERRILGRDLRLAGSVKVTTPFVTVCYLLSNALAGFASAYPAIDVEVNESSTFVDLSMRRADVALRISLDAPEHWVGRQLGIAKYRVYGRRGAEEPFDAATPFERLFAHPRWVALGSENPQNRFARWIDARAPRECVRMRVDVFNSVVVMLKAGCGIGILPTYVGNQELDLVPLSEEITELATPVRILTHPDVRHAARIQAFMRFVGDAVAQTMREHG